MKTLFTLILSFLAIHFISAQEVTVNKDLTVDRTLNAAEIVVDSLFPALRFKVNGSYKFNFDYVESNDRFILSNGSGIPMEIIGSETHIKNLNLENSLTLEGSSKNFELSNSNDTLVLQEEGMSPALGIHGEKVFLKQEENSAVGSRRKLEIRPDGSLVSQNVDTLYLSPLDFQGPNAYTDGTFVRGNSLPSDYFFAKINLPEGVEMKSLQVFSKNTHPDEKIAISIREVNNSFKNQNQDISTNVLVGSILPSGSSNRSWTGINLPPNSIVNKGNSYFIRVTLTGSNPWSVQEIHGMFLIYEH